MRKTFEGNMKEEYLVGREKKLKLKIKVLKLYQKLKVK